MPSAAAIVAIRKFASIPRTCTNFGIVNDTSNSVIPVPHLNPKFSSSQQLLLHDISELEGAWQ
jgi:hypothetical protein